MAAPQLTGRAVENRRLCCGLEDFEPALCGQQHTPRVEAARRRAEVLALSQSCRIDTGFRLSHFIETRAKRLARRLV